MAGYHIAMLDGDLEKVGELSRVRSIDIERSITDKASLLESCTVVADCDAVPDAGWYRIERNGDAGKDVLGTFKLTPSGTSMDRGVITATLAGRSVLHPAADASVATGEFAGRGADAPVVAAQLLADCPSPVSYEGHAELQSAIVYGDGCSKLEAAWAVLDAVGWRIRLDGYGNIYIEPMPDAVSRTVSESTGGTLPSFSVESDGVSYSRTYDGETSVGDLVEIVLPRYGFKYSGRVLSQSMSAGSALVVSEKIGVDAR